MLPQLSYPFLTRHHTPQLTTVLAGLQMHAYFTPILQSPAFYQTPHTTVYYGVHPGHNLPALLPYAVLPCVCKIGWGCVCVCDKHQHCTGLARLWRVVVCGVWRNRQALAVGVQVSKLFPALDIVARSPWCL